MRSRAGKFRLRALLVAGIVAPALLFGLATWQGYLDAVRDAEERVERSAAILAEQAAKLFDNAVLTMELVEQRLAVTPSSELTGLDFHTFLSDRVTEAAPIHSMGLIRGDGALLATSRFFPAPGLNLADHEPFIAALGAQGTVVSRRAVARATGEPVFFVSRPWTEGGEVLGVVTLSFYIHYFENLFAAMVGPDDPHPAVSLIRTDGHRLVRHPRLPHELPAEKELSYHDWLNVSEASVQRAAGLVDGIDRFYGLHKVPGYPLQVRFGRSASSLLAQWWRTTLLNGAIALLVIVLLSGLTVLAMRQERAARRQEKRMQVLVRERTAQAERANQAKSHFLAAASHDLRQPIQGLRLFLDVLDGRLVEHTDRQVLARASQALEGAEALLSTLLDVSALEAGVVAAQMRDIPLGEVLSALEAEFAPQAANAGLDFRCVMTERWGRADPVLLARVLRNLLTNAVRYTGRGGLLLGCRRAGRMIRIEVWDTGPGIPDDMLETVFDDFVQLGNPERDRAKGLGLGLAVARRMAGLMDHRLGVRSRLGRGTMFSVELPAVQHAHGVFPKVQAEPASRHIQIA